VALKVQSKNNNSQRLQNSQSQGICERLQETLVLFIALFSSIYDFLGILLSFFSNYI